MTTTHLTAKKSLGMIVAIIYSRFYLFGGTTFHVNKARTSEATCFGMQLVECSSL